MSASSFARCCCPPVECNCDDSWLDSFDVYYELVSCGCCGDCVAPLVYNVLDLSSFAATDVVTLVRVDAGTCYWEADLPGSIDLVAYDTSGPCETELSRQTLTDIKIWAIVETEGPPSGTMTIGMNASSSFPPFSVDLLIRGGLACPYNGTVPDGASPCSEVCPSPDEAIHVWCTDGVLVSYA